MVENYLFAVDVALSLGKWEVRRRFGSLHLLDCEGEPPNLDRVQDSFFLRRRMMLNVLYQDLANQTLLCAILVNVSFFYRRLLAK